jgi:predicted ATP-grasp superfamily ATP-dependent carboligase
MICKNLKSFHFGLFQKQSYQDFESKRYRVRRFFFAELGIQVAFLMDLFLFGMLTKKSSHKNCI